MHPLRNATRSGLLLLGFGLALGAAAAAAADDAPAAAQSAPAPNAASADAAPAGAAQKAERPALYVPPSRGSVRTRSGGATRGRRSGLPLLQALAPDHVGLSRSPQPTLYWSISEDAKLPVHLTLVRYEQPKPLLEIALDEPLRAGLHAIRLDERGVRLEAGVAYQWFVALVPDPAHRSRDLVVGGAVEYQPAEATSSGAEPNADFEQLARAGIWYDAVDALRRRLDRDPGARPQWEALLAQVGLEAP